MKRAFFAMIALAALALTGCETYQVATSEGYYDYTHETDMTGAPADPSLMAE